jgi:phosphatidylserine decarboxylase
VKIAREGYPFAATGLLLAGACWVGVWAGITDPADWNGRALLAGAGLLTVLAVFVLWFFRDPEPALPPDADAVVAPGQGRIIVVDDVDEPTVLGGAAKRISIFLSVFDVHVQRAPVAGEVIHKEHRPGAYVAAWADKASEDNEQASVGIEAAHGRVLVKQIAGLVARRIVTDPEVGEHLERGERFGLIRFGSRVDLFLPVHWEILCEVGDRVRSGETALARQRILPEAGTARTSAAVGSADRPASTGQEERAP